MFTFTSSSSRTSRIFYLASEISADVVGRKVIMMELSSKRQSCDRKEMFYWQSDRPFSELEIKQIFLDRFQNFDLESLTLAVEYGLQQSGRSGDAARVANLDRPVQYGSVNSVSRVGLKDGTSVILRAHPNGIKNGYFWAEACASQKCKDIGIPACSTILIDDTQRLVPFDYMLTEVLPGRNFKEMMPVDQGLEASLLEQTGALMAKIHSIKTNGFGFFDNELAKRSGELRGIHQSWEEHVFAALDSNIAYLAGHSAISPSMAEKIREILSKHKAVIKLSEPRLVHNDVADWNELVDAERISGIVDWDECFSGDPVCDLATWTVHFPFARFPHLKQGYESVSPLPDDFEQKFHYYRLRYIVSKMTLRTKRSVYDKGEFINNLLAYSHQILEDELAWFGE